MLPQRKRILPFGLCLVVALLVGVFLPALSDTTGAALAPSLTSQAAGASPASPEGAAPAHALEQGAERGGGHADPFSRILLALAVLILAAVFGRWLAGRFNQASVLGELVIGIIVGNLGYALREPFFVLVMHLEAAGEIFQAVWTTGLPVGDVTRQIFSPAELTAGGIGEQITQLLTGPEAGTLLLMALALWMFSNLGVILLLFMVGLESSVEEMLQVGPRAILVAVVGIVAPFFLGFAASTWLLPESSPADHLFLGAILAATSVGITARVFKDLNKLHTQEAKIVLGAAVIDDILGLIILAVVAGIVTTGEIRLNQIAQILILSVVFFTVLIFLGDRIVCRGVSLFSRGERRNLKLLFPLTLAFLAAFLANAIGLAAIVGAFAAGLILSEKHFEPHTDSQVTAREMIAPLEALFAPIFFVLMGMQVKLASFLQPGTLGLALAFVLAAIVGKLVAGLPAGRGTDRLSVGIGMIPRGEVGLIFASIGKGLGVVSDAVFSAVVIMVIVTTLIAPLGLRWSLFRTPATPPIA